MTSDIKILTLAECASTMDEAAARAKVGDFSHAAIRAQAQTAGRGRLGRVWRTFPHHSLAATLLWPGAPVPHLALLAALSLRQAIEQLHPAGKHVAIKWPNDLLAGPDLRKVAGLLVEGGQGPAGPFTLLGVGVNLTPSPEQPADFVGTSLMAALGEPAMDVGKLLNVFMTCLFENLRLYEGQGWAPFHAEYVRHCVTIGQNISWRRSTGWGIDATGSAHELTGRVRGLTANGHLELVDDDGKVHVISSGEVNLQGRSHA